MGARYLIRRSRERFGCNLANSDEIAVLAALHSADGGGVAPVLGQVPDWVTQRFEELPKELRWCWRSCELLIQAKEAPDTV